MQVFSSY